MDQERWRSVEGLFHSALERGPEARQAFLDVACGGDTDLQRQVELLLAKEKEAGSFLETPAIREMAETATATGALVGREFGPYRIVSPLGAGGMGEVYRAHDSKLGRDVAIKTLSPEFARDPDRLARFRREARTLASLNHPNIAAIYGLEQSGDLDCLVLELVEGESMRGPLPVEQALDYAHQVAEALEAAHAKGIIHRDLKPANVKVTPQGRVKVFDFGLAKAIWGSEQNQDLSQSATMTGGETLVGHILGTPGYMSPEQARGKEVDERTDIWAFGCLLYELLTGRHAFHGETTEDTMTAVLEREPDWKALPPKTPAPVRELLRECLQKDASRRLQSIADARRTIEEVQRRQKRWPVTAAAAVAVFGIGVALWMRGPARSPDRAQWVPLTTSPDTGVSKKDSPGWHLHPLTTYPGGEYEPAFSRDGRQVAFVWDGEKQDNFDIYVKFIDGGAPRRLTTSAASEGSPAWSPDGQRIAFIRYSTKPGESGFYVVPALGGPEQRIGNAAPLPHIFDRHLDWSPDGRFLAVVDKTDPGGPFGIFLIAIDTGDRRRITTPQPGSIGDTGPAFSPDGRIIAFKRSIGPGINDIYLVSVSGGEPKRLTFGNRFTTSHAWTPDGRELIFASAQDGVNGLWRISASGGAPRQIPDVGQGAYYLAIARTGHYLAYSHWFADTNIWRLEIPSVTKKIGKPEPLISSTWEDRSAQYSPDGARIAFRSDRSGTNEIWLCDSSGANPRQLTSFQGPLTGTPRWSPDGKLLAFDSRPLGHSDVYTIPAVGGAPHRITTGGSESVVPSWSHDGRWIYFGSNRTGDWQVWKIPVTGGFKDGDPLQITHHGGFAAFESVDGQFLYYAKGRDVPGLWVIPAGGGEEKPVISDFAIGFWGYWAVISEGIYYLAPAPLHGGALMFYSFKSSSARLVASIPKDPPFSDSGFAVSPDGRFILYTQVDHSGSDLMLVEGFR